MVLRLARRKGTYLLEYSTFGELVPSCLDGLCVLSAVECVARFECGGMCVEVVCVCVCAWRGERVQVVESYLVGERGWRSQGVEGRA